MRIPSIGLFPKRRSIGKVGWTQIDLWMAVFIEAHCLRDWYQEVCVCVCLYVHVCRGLRRTLGVLFYHSPLYSLETGSLPDLELVWQLANALSPPVTFLVLRLLSLVCNSFLMWVPRSELRSSCLCSQYSFPLSHPFSPIRSLEKSRVCLGRGCLL